MTEALRILILEDSPPDAELAQRSLREDGLEFVSTVVDTEPAFVRELHGFCPDLVLSDYQLPQFNGMDAIRLVREHAPHVPVVVLSGAVDEETAVECMKSGAVDYVLKERPARLPSAVKRAVEQARERKQRKIAEAASREMHQELRAVVESAHDAIVVADSEGSIVSWNPGASNIFGYSEHQAVGSPLTMLMPERFREAHQGGWERFQDTGHSQLVGGTVELTARRKDGGEFPIEFSLGSWERDGRRLVTAIIRDCSDRTAARIALEGLSHQHELILNAAGEGIIGVDAEGHVTFVNLSASKAIGCEASDMLGKDAHTVLGHTGSKCDPLREEGCTVLASLRDGRLHRGRDDDFTRRDGTRFQVEWVTTPIQTGDVPAGAVIVFSDVSESRAADLALQKSETKYRMLVENATYGIYRSHPTRGFLSVNNALIFMLGYERAEDLLKLNMETELYADPSDRKRLIERPYGLDRFEGVEVDWKKKDGSVITVRLNGRILRSDDGSIECFETFAVDVTERRKLEAQLRQAQKMEAVGQLSGGIAHDFNNVLSVILADTDLLLSAEGAEAGETTTILKEINEAARRGAAVVRQLLGFSRKADLVPVPTDLGAVTGRVSSMIQRVLPATIRVATDGLEQGCTGVADAGAVEQILLNLTNNARDAMPEGGDIGIEVKEVRLEEQDKVSSPWIVPGEYVCVSVSDTGIGMSDETKARCFDPFFTTKPVGVGTGLGMAMVYGLMKQLNGYVHVYSELGVGTTTRLYFPSAPGGAPELAPFGEAEDSIRGGTETILLVEDEPALRRAGSRVLKSLGYSVLTAENGEEGLQQYREDSGQIDLIVSDVVMPKMGGQELLKELRAAGDNVRFILCSGYRECDTQERAVIALTVPYLQKPWTVQELAQQVRAVLDEPGPQGVES